MLVYWISGIYGICSGGFILELCVVVKFYIFLCWPIGYVPLYIFGFGSLFFHALYHVDTEVHLCPPSKNSIILLGVVGFMVKLSSSRLHICFLCRGFFSRCAGSDLVARLFCAPFVIILIAGLYDSSHYIYIWKQSSFYWSLAFLQINPFVSLVSGPF